MDELNEHELLYNEEATEPLQSQFEEANYNLEEIFKYYYSKYNWSAYNIMLNPENKELTIEFLKQEYDITFKEVQKLQIQYNKLNNQYHKYYEIKRKHFNNSIGTALGVARGLLLAPISFIKGLLS